MRARVLVASALSIAALAATACRRDTATEGRALPTSSTFLIADASAPPAIASVAGSATVAASGSIGSIAAAPIDAACVVAYAKGTTLFAPGDDVSAAKVPIALPAGASLTLSVRRTGHEVTVNGPAVFRPCTALEPDVVLVTSGTIELDFAVTVRPGAEIFIATPSCVAIVQRASVRLEVDARSTAWLVERGDATITDLETKTAATDGNKGMSKRYADGGVLLTRCGVQAASVATTDRLLASIGTPSSPVPSASIGALTAEQIKHGRERVVDCAFAEAFGLSCDRRAAGDGDGSGCRGGYNDVLAHIAVSTAPSTLPPGSLPGK